MWEGWVASPTQLIWICISSRSWWWTGRPGVLQSMGSQRVGHDWAAELKLTDLMLKFQYFGHLMQRANSLEKNLMLGKIGGKRTGLQKIRWLDSITDSMDMNFSKLWKMVGNRGAWYAAIHGVAKIQTQLSDATTATPTVSLLWNEECWHFPFLDGFSTVKSLKILLCTYLEVEPKPFPKAELLFLGCSSLCLHPFLFLISNYWNMPFVTQGKPWRLESAPYK